MYYPGKGHSADNIVVWLPQYKVLFGGCLVKSLDYGGLGSTTDAEVIVPGHGGWGSIELTEHTLELLKQHD